MGTSEYNRLYYQANRERLLVAQRERGKRNYQANPEKYAARSKRWRQENPDRYRELTKRYASENREKVKETSRLWYAENKARAAATNRRNKLRGYGLTQDQFEAMMIDQMGQCLICCTEMNPPAVDHDHATGEVRGLLCRQCNAALGLLRDDPAILARAAAYLTRSSSGVTSTASSQRLKKLSTPAA